MTDTLDATEATPRMRPYKAVQITANNIDAIAHALDEHAYADPGGNMRLSLGGGAVPTGWWVVWDRDRTSDRNFYSNEEFHAMYEEKGANVSRWPTEHLIILLDAFCGDTHIDCPDVAMRTSTGNYMLSGGSILGESHSTILNYAPATAMRIDHAKALLAEETKDAPPVSRLASEALDLIAKQNMMNLRTKP